MIRATTPTFILHLIDVKTKLPPENLDLREAANIYFTIKQDFAEVNKTGADIEVIDANTLSVFLSQDESLMLKEYVQTKLQVNWTYPKSAHPDRIYRASTLVKEFKIDEQLLKRAIE